MRNTLVSALVSCVENPVKLQARRFLLGLSADELQFIAEFFGACLLEPPRMRRYSRAQLAERIAEFQISRHGCCPSRDQDHKMILLLEYLSRWHGHSCLCARGMSACASVMPRSY